jgi:hypothetical protein
VNIDLEKEQELDNIQNNQKLTQLASKAEEFKDKKIEELLNKDILAIFTEVGDLMKR